MGKFRLEMSIRDRDDHGCFSDDCDITSPDEVRPDDLGNRMYTIYRLHGPVGRLRYQILKAAEARKVLRSFQKHGEQAFELCMLEKEMIFLQHVIDEHIASKQEYAAMADELRKAMAERDKRK